MKPTQMKNNSLLFIYSILLPFVHQVKVKIANKHAADKKAQPMLVQQESTAIYHGYFSHQ